MSVIYARGQALVEALSAAGVAATTEPGAAIGLLPCVLVPPPVREVRHYGGHVVTWRLVVLADLPDATRSWEQLDDLVDRVADLLPIERAEPTSYVLPSGTDPVPAYAVTFTETVTGEDLS